MCGRFTRTDYLHFIAEKFSIDEIYSELNPSYNITPGDYINAVVIRENKRLLLDLKWGLVPHWSKDPAIGSRMINARSETITEKPSFKHAVKSRRCLIVANGFYEWEKKEKGKIPVYIYLKDKRLFGFAGLYERWTSPEGKELNTCTIITTESNDLLAHIHNRMPVIIQDKDIEMWLDPENIKAEEIMTLLRPLPSEIMKWHYVSKSVNSPKNNAPELIEPV